MTARVRTFERSQGIWRHGPHWLRPFSVAAPWITLGLLLVMLHVVGGTLTSAKGVLFDLPSADLSEGDQTSLVALAMPMANETFVFFDDARYALGDNASAAAFREHLSERTRKARRRTLLLMADRRIATGELMKIASLSRSSGVARVLIANKRQETAE